LKRRWHIAKENSHDRAESVSLSGINVANDKPFVLFGGMNVLESRDLAHASG
jgi:3-deoxy-D-manno-octulosonic acid (KDO) 8-phosphate synthase